jgi:hypothetical protein
MEVYMGGAGVWFTVMEAVKRPLRKIVVVFKTHFDLGFTDLPENIMDLYTGEMFSAVREVMAATAGEPEGLGYAWTLPAWPLKQLLHDPQVPEETRSAAHDLVSEGRLHWHAWPFTTHTAFCGMEDMVRGLHISRALSEEFGRWPSGAKQTDVPGHTWIYPTILARAGVQFLHLGCNSGSHAPHVPRIFWWEGPDGSRLLTYYSTGGYGTSPLPPDDWQLDTWLAVQHTLDNHGPHSPEDLQRIRAAIAESAPGVEVIFGELGDFTDSLLQNSEQLSDLPVVPYDLADTWIHGVGTMPREVARVRELRADLLALEIQAATLDWPRNEADAARDFKNARKIATHIDEAYQQLLLFSEHTWGLDVKSTITRAFGSNFEQARRTEPYKRLESSWAAKTAYVDRAENAYDTARRAGGTGITRLRKLRPTLPDKPEIYIHSTSRDPHDLEAFGTIVATTRISTSDKGQQNVIENAYLRVEVDPSAGGIISLIDKRTNHDWAGPISDFGFRISHLEADNPAYTSLRPSSFVLRPTLGRYRYDTYSARDIAEFLRSYGNLFQDWFVHDFGKTGYPEDTAHLTAYARDYTLSREGTSLLLSGGSLHSEPGGVLVSAEQVSIKIRLPASEPYIDIEYTVTGKAATPLAESAVAEFPLNLPKPAFRIGQTGSVIDPLRDIAAGANRYLWCAQWVDASDDRIGLGVIPIDMPLLSIGDVGIYRFDPDRVPTDPTIFAHFLNTQWGTNFPQWHEGDFTFRVRLAPHAGDWRTGQLWRTTLNTTSSPIQSSRIENALDHLPIRASDGLVLTTLRPRHDGPGIIARYWDALALHRQATIQIDGPVKRVRRCDLMERPFEELGIRKKESGVSIELTIAPHAIETLLIEFERDA